MWPSVQASFLAFTGPLEGWGIRWPYLDEIGLVTVGYGDLIDPVSAALMPGVEWAEQGIVAGPEQVRAAWARVKALQNLRKQGSEAFEPVTALRLTDAGLAHLIAWRLGTDAASAARRFPRWAAFPADAQMGWLSIAWAAGASSRWPKLTAAANAGDFGACVGECDLAERYRGEYAARNAQTRLCFRNAAAVSERGDDPSVLHWPTALSELG